MDATHHKYLSLSQKLGRAARVWLGLMRGGKASTVLVIVLLVISGVFYYKYQQAQNNIPAVEIKSITDVISKTVVLPDEQPQLATVTDKTLLQDQEFFALAENGDKVLIYQDSQKIFLYRPSTKKVINVSSIRAVTDAQSSASPGKFEVTQQPVLQVQPSPTVIDSMPTPTPSLFSSKQSEQSIGIALYNGTPTLGATATARTQLESNNIPGVFQILGRANMQTYQQTVVIALSPEGKNYVGEITRILEGKAMETLPEGEVIPPAQTDVVVIVGSGQVGDSE